MVFVSCLFILQSEWGKFDEIGEDLLVEIEGKGKYKCRFLTCAELTLTSDFLSVLSQEEPLRLRFEQEVLACSFPVSDIDINPTFVCIECLASELTTVRTADWFV